MRNRNKIITKILLGVGFLALSSIAQAVSPPPDGSYPGGNTAEGTNALLNLSTGMYNTSVGFDSLLSITDGSFCTGVGAGTLLANTAVENTATGAGALLSNTTGGDNTANGAFALSSNTTGSLNTAIGARALRSLTGNSFRNTAIGFSALSDNIAGGSNTAVGDIALSNSTGSNNTAIGESAGLNQSSGNNNTALGQLAGSNLTTGDNNIDIGYNVVGVAGESNTIRIGDTDITDTFIRGISGTTVASGAAVLVAANGHLGTLTSSKRFKDDIKPMDKASEALFALKPVTFRYKKELDPVRTQQFGLVAEDVEKVDPDLVLRDESGKINTVRYDQVNAMLLNEFLKEHKAFIEQQRKVQEQEATITQLMKEMEAVIAHAKEQDSKIQKVSDHVEINKSGPRVVRNDPGR